MPRNTEVIRQWNVLREIEVSRRVTIRRLSSITGVSTRTIRRDLEALQEAGFPIFDEQAEGERYWRLDTRPFRALTESGLTLDELAALHFSRALLAELAGAPFRDELTSAFAKLDRSLPPRMRQFLDRLPEAIQAKPQPVGKRASPHQRDLTNRLLDAILHRRRVEMRYHSYSSRRQKDYRVDPYRLVYAHGGLYLFAFVPDYGELRTFAIERIRHLSPLEETFQRLADAGNGGFADSLGTYHGVPERIDVRFAPQAARYVQERVWHPSQTVRRERTGAVVLTLHVSNDRALRSWILSFGRFAHVLAPARLVTQIARELKEASKAYAGLGRNLGPEPA